MTTAQNSNLPGEITMQSYDYEYPQADLFASDASQEARVTFLHKTYAHVAGAVLLFMALTCAFVSIDALAAPMARFAFGNWWAVLIAYMAASYAASAMARSGASVATQYAGLGLYAAAEALIFTPLLYILHTRMPGGDDVILQAAGLTLLIFGGLTATVLLTKVDFSFLRGIISVLSFAALGLIVVSMFTTLSLGTWFVAGMIVLMAGCILYETSNVLHHYPVTAHVAAALALFSSLSTLFWYVLQLVMAMQRD